MAASAASLAQIWDNDEDAVYSSEKLGFGGRRYPSNFASSARVSSASGDLISSKMDSALR